MSSGMDDQPRLPTGQNVLWDIGAALIDADVEEADAVLNAVLGVAARRLGVSSASLWTFNRRSMEGRRTHHWAARPDAELQQDQLAVSPELPAKVEAGDGVAVVALEEVLGEDLCRDRGWTGAAAAIAMVDRTDDTTVVLVAAGPEELWDAEARVLGRSVTMLFRQFHRRVRSERELRYRLELEDLLASIGERFLTVGPDELDAVIVTVLEDVRRIMEARTVVVVDVLDAHRVAVPYMGSEMELDDTWRIVDIPDIGAIPGAAGKTLHEFVAETHLLELDEITDATLGPEVTDAFGLRDPRHTVALVPAAVDVGGSMLSASRVGDRDWLPHEVDALSTISSLLAQVRGRVEAQSSSRSYLETQQALAAIGKSFLEADYDQADRAIEAALEQVASVLGADVAVVAEAVGDAIAFRHSWSPDPELVVPPGTMVTQDEQPQLWELFTDRTEISVLDGNPDDYPRLSHPDQHWTASVSPVRGFGPQAAVALAWWTSESGDDAHVRDTTSVLADLIGQLKVRLRAEADLRRRLELDVVLSETADAFLGASLNDVDQVVGSALTRVGEAMEMKGLVLRGLHEGDSVVECTWTAVPAAGPPVGHRVPVPPDAFANGFVGYDLTYEDLGQWDQVRDDLWGPGSHLNVMPVYVGGTVDATLNAIHSDTLLDVEREALRSFAVMVGQLRSRMAEERRGRRRLESQRLLSACAADLAEAGIDDFTSVVEGVLARVGTFCGLGALVNVRVDWPGEQHHSRTAWLGDEFTASARTVADFGEIPILDQAASTGRLLAVVEAEPHPERPTIMAIPRHSPSGVDHVLLASRLTTTPWTDDVVELLGSLNHLFQEVEVRIAAQRYAGAAFSGAPIGIVLRDQNLRLITCNQAFVDFVGAESIDEIVGTMPHEVYDDSYEDIEWSDVDGELRSEAAFRGPGGSRVWGQMRASVVQDEVGGHFWLVHVEDITERRRVEQLLRFQASHDELTGLANRRRLLQEIHRIADGEGSVAVLLLDLDRFKIINDSLGHDRGDELLVVIADRLRLAVRPGDLVARLGGDEFAIVLPGPLTVSDAEFVAERMLRLIGEPVSLGHHQVYPTASIGIAVADDQTEVDDLIRRADTAMYRAKAEGRDRSEAFDEHLRDAVTLRMATESGLRRALRNDELLVHYQPEVSLDDGRLLGAEALVRWRHPEQGILAAGAFIEVAEETGLIVDIGEIVLAQACREAASWPGGDRAPTIRVNLAAAQLQREDTVALVQAVLAETGLAPHRLCLEITESAVMNDVRRSEAILWRLKELGLELAVDDFGTGFSSLAYLKRFPVDVLKIDRTFVGDLGSERGDETFVRSIVSLAEALGLDVVAEGVETEEQVARLQAIGCHRAQGYLFARPGPADQLQPRLREITR